MSASEACYEIKKGRWRRDKRVPDNQAGAVKPKASDEEEKEAQSACKSAAKNEAIEIALRNLRISNVFMTDPHAMSALQSIVKGGSIYKPAFFTSRDDYYYYSNLLKELVKTDEGDFSITVYQNGTQKPINQPEVSDEALEASLVKWSRHSVFENPKFSTTFCHLLEKLETFFDVEIYASRLNFYKDGTDWKPFHHDSHAYSKDHKQKEDFTMGASFGASRELVFLHEKSNQQIPIPQHNGDVFAFNGEVNMKLKHGVPKAPRGKIGPRFSVIAWGRRRTLSEKNASITELAAQQKKTRAALE